MRLKWSVIFCVGLSLACAGSAWGQAPVAVGVMQSVGPAILKFADFVGKVTVSFAGGAAKGAAEEAGRATGKLSAGQNGSPPGGVDSPNHSGPSVAAPKYLIAEFGPGWRVLTPAKHCVKRLDRNECYPCNLDSIQEICVIRESESPIILSCQNSNCYPKIPTVHVSTPPARTPPGPPSRAHPKSFNIQVLYSEPRLQEAMKISNILSRRGYTSNVNFSDFSSIPDKAPGVSRIIYKTYTKNDCHRLSITLMQSISSPRVIFEEHNRFLNGDIQIQLY